MAKSKPAPVRMRIRIYAGGRMLGPGKMELLAHVSRIGSLSGAAKKMGMSYMRAWNLVQELNRNSNRPVIALSRGGANGGAASVTPFGKKVLALYQRMEKESRKVAAPYGRKLARLLERV
jgi:molybdate transport system regulatory protein